MEKREESTIPRPGLAVVGILLFLVFLVLALKDTGFIDLKFLHISKELTQYLMGGSGFMGILFVLLSCIKR